MTDKTKHHGEQHFCRDCLQRFSSSRVLECHIADYLRINHKILVLLLEENECVNFQNFEKLTKALFIIYCDW